MLSLILALTLHGQTGLSYRENIGVQPVAHLPLMESIDPGEYTVGPGDVFWFSVQGGLPSELTGLPGSSYAYLTVTPDGHVVIPAVGAYFVSGMLLAEAADLVESGFSSRFPGLRATAGLADVRQSRITVTGQVGTPGLIAVSGSDRLTDLLTAAGGIDPAGSWTRIRILHEDGDTTLVDITRYLLDGVQASNPLLRMGDRVHVPGAEQLIYIEGAFQASPDLAVSEIVPSEIWPWTGSISGMLEYIPGESVDRCVDRVGGTAPWASREACYIARTGQDSIPVILPVPLDDPSVHPQLLPGDRIVCPGNPPVVAVSGLVYAPGVFPHVAGEDAFYYLSQAGGYTVEASRGGTRVILPDGGERSVDDLLAIPAGSTITVPRKALVWWQDPLLIVTSVASIILAWRSLD